MAFFAKISQCTAALRLLVGERYHPERHYMRGPGPACARRHHAGRDLTFS